MNAPRYTQVYCSQCGQAFGPGGHSYSHCSDHRRAAHNLVVQTIPCTVGDEMEYVVLPAVLECAAEHQPAVYETRDDPGEPEGYEIRHSHLRVAADLSALATESYCIRVDGGKPVFVSISPEAISAGDVIALDDCDLAEELSSYLMESAA